MKYAIDLRNPKDKAGSVPRKRTAAEYDELKDGSKMLADQLYTEALELAKILAPDVPADTEKLDDQVQWAVLEKAGMIMPPHTWDDPDAINALLRLRRKFVPALAERTEYLKEVAKLRKVERDNLPDLNITPASPEWEHRK